MVGAACVAMGTLATPAWACFDGYAAEVDGVEITGFSEGTWSMAEARMLARWLPRIAALTPAGVTVTMMAPFAPVERCDATECEGIELRNPGEEHLALDHPAYLERVFRRLASHQRASSHQVARAYAATRPLYLVQIGSFRSGTEAHRRAEALNEQHRMGELPWEPRSFYSAGGFPAVHDPVHVVPVDVGGARYHRLVAGLFVMPEDARSYQRYLDGQGVVAAVAIDRS